MVASAQGHQTCGSYISTLPNEILSEILSLAVHLHESDELCHRFPSVLCQVSRHWREVTYSTPSIWALILVFNLHTFKYTPARLARTGSIPLTIKVTDPNHELDVARVAKLLVPESGRWAVLWLDVQKLSEYQIYLPKVLPLLRRIHLDDNGSPPRGELSLPRLKYMKLKTTELGCISLASFATLTDLHAEEVKIPFGTLQLYLQGAPVLEVLSLSCSWLLKPEQDAELLKLLSHLIELPLLTTLVVDTMFPWEVVMLLPLLRAPALRKLMIGFAEGDEGEVPDFLGLHHLDLNLPPLQVLGLRNLRVLGEEAQEYLLRLPETEELCILDRHSIKAGFAFETLVMKPALAGMISRLSAITILGAPFSTMLKCLSSPYLPVTSQRLRDRVKFRVHFSILRGDQSRGDGQPADDDRRLELFQHVSNLEIIDGDRSTASVLGLVEL